MQDELVERVADAVQDVMGPVFGSPEYLADPVKLARAQKRRREGALAYARAIIPIVQAATLDLVERHLSACAYEPAPYTCMKHRLAAIRNQEPTNGN